MRRWLSLLIVLASTHTAGAWNKPGHMVSAAIAYEKLKMDSPATVTHVIELLKSQPKYNTQWAERLDAVPNLTVDEKQLYLFMLAARWADDIRVDAGQNHSPWHFINLPYKPAGQPETVATKPPDPDNIIRAFHINLGRAKDQKLPKEDRAIALCWVFHLVGDAHQPLHTSSMFTIDFPRGDKGGNLFKIKVRPNSAPISLHQFWDDLILGSDRFQTVRNRATELQSREHLAHAKLQELSEQSFDNWINNESFPLVRTVVYRDGQLKGGTEPGNAEVLPDDYPQAAKPIAERRIVLAGYRLAELLKNIFPPVTAPDGNERH